jgi:small subunit ribosomal protein S8
MTMTDPVADMLTRLRNANSAYHDTVTMPYSKLKGHIADILKAQGYIAAWKVEDAEVGKKLTIDLKFGPNRERSIAGVRRISKPACAFTRSPPTCRTCWVAWESPSCPRPPVC